MRRATIAVTDIPSPIAMAYMISRTVSVIPTAASASAPRRATKNASTTANRDSPAISSIIGMARRNTARFRLPVVKSCSVPWIASRIEVQNRRWRPAEVDESVFKVSVIQIKRAARHGWRSGPHQS
jgi:hypothetical protein